MAKQCLIEKQKKTPKFKVRGYNRCSLCGRRHGYMRFFGICRICFREKSHRGELPGVKKSSW
jgi:small subunit ribosomal protein S14